MTYEEMKRFVPADRNRSVDWAGLLDAVPQLRPMIGCAHDFYYHNEGDVWVHTKMVAEEMLALDGFWQADAAGRFVLFWAAILHDIAKPICIVIIENGRVSQKGHSKRGSIDTRILLWRAGVPFEEREAICRLILRHQYPYSAILKDNPAFIAHQLSHEISLSRLALLAEADSRGRRTIPEAFWQESIDNVELFRELAIEEDCLNKPRRAADAWTGWRYFRSEGAVSPDYPIYRKAGSPVVMMAGLPASGKDTWVAHNYPDWPIVSFDAARAELGLKHGENDGRAAHLAIDRAKEFLRKKAPFIWNVTHLSSQIRSRSIDLCAAYGADIDIIYLEASEQTLLARNSERDTTLTNEKLLKMLWRWEVPLPWEAPIVRYVVKT